MKIPKFIKRLFNRIFNKKSSQPCIHIYIQDDLTSLEDFTVIIKGVPPEEELDYPMDSDFAISCEPEINEEDKKCKN